MEHILDNAYTNRDFEYLKSKNVEVCIIIQHKVTKEISLRSSVPLIDVKSMLQKTDRDKEQSQWVSEHQRKYFPKSDGPITNVFNNKGKLIVMASKVMSFWKEVRDGQAMGIGQFPAWDNFELDMGKIQILEKQFEKVKNHHPGFLLKMSDVIEWSDFSGMKGIGGGNLKKVKLPLSWLDVLKILIMWSYSVIGVSIEDNIDPLWSPSCDDFQKQKKMFTKPRPKTTSGKPKVSQLQRKEGKKRGVERAKQCLFDPTQSDMELAFALSVSEELEKERHAELENSDLAVALRVSMEERHEVGSGGVEVER